MGVAVNLSKFGRIRFVDDQGRLTREAQIELNAIQQRSGGITGVINAADIAYSPSGGLAATDAQSAIEELELEKQAKDATLTAVAGVTTAADKLIYWTGVDSASVCDFTAFARSLLAGADASTVLTTLGVSTFAKTILDDADASAVRTTLGLVIGTNVQAYSANLTTWAGKTAPSGTVVGTSDAQTLTNKTLSNPILTGSTFFEQPTRTTKTGVATLTIAELLTKIIYYTGAAATLTMPTGTDIDAGVLSGALAVDRAFEFVVINSGSGTATIGVAAGLLMVGDTTVPASASATFRVHKTASATFTVYRVT